jgi:hypothetical protein
MRRPDGLNRFVVIVRKTIGKAKNNQCAAPRVIDAETDFVTL